MYKKSLSVLIFFVLFFVFAKWGPAINFSTTTQTKGEPFVVSGTGKISVVPDVAKIGLGIQESGTSLKLVQDSVNKKSQNLVSQLKKLGVDEKDIKTTSYNIFPNYDYNTSPQKIAGYEVSINYEVTVRDFDKVNDILSTSTDFGANIIGGVNFDLSDNLKKQKLQEARTLAVKEAKDKAEGLAKAAGISLGKIINVSEQGQNQDRPILLLEKANISQPDIQPGETEINVSISLFYEIR